MSQKNLPLLLSLLSSSKVAFASSHSTLTEISVAIDNTHTSFHLRLSKLRHHTWITWSHLPFQKLLSFFIGFFNPSLKLNFVKGKPLKLFLSHEGEIEHQPDQVTLRTVVVIVFVAISDVVLSIGDAWRDILEIRDVLRISQNVIGVNTLQMLLADLVLL